MIFIKLFDENLKYDIENLIKIFTTEYTFNVDALFLNSDFRLNIDELSFTYGNIKGYYMNKNDLKKKLYLLLEKDYESLSDWGILVGVRPQKKYNELMDIHSDKNKVSQILNKDFLVKESKINLMELIHKAQLEYMGDLDNISLYMSIPFCPTICSYCSFPSFSLAKKGSYLEKYIDYLIEEIKYSIDIAKKENKIIDNIYIGGGTPGVLNGQILEKLLKSITTLIDMKVVKEFTFEAGRPELIDQQMLIILKKFGVNRVCINTQTTNNKTLSIIDRNHSSEEFLRAVKLAKDSDINSINVDIIAGLPTEDFDTFKNTLETVINTGVDNITIHTLAIKTNSFINRNKEAFNLPKFETVKYMVEYSTKRLSELGFKPYYMYRQKNMIGNLENIGYSLETKESIYNIRIIEEQHPILALGVGGVSKMKIGYNHFDRIANFKSLEDYFNRFDEVLERKRKFFGA